MHISTLKSRKVHSMNHKMVPHKNLKSANYENAAYLSEALFDIEENDVFKLCVNKFYRFY